MTSEAQGQELAEEFRTQHGLGALALADISELIETTTGIEVAVIPVDDPEAHGLTLRDPATGVTRIAAACTASPMLQRSTLLHELCHHVCDDHLRAQDLDWSRRPQIEQRANSFARHMLLPMAALEQLAHAFPEQLDESTLSSLVQHFMASPAMVAIQLYSSGHISRSQKESWMATSTPALALRFGWRDRYEAMRQESMRRRSPQRLLARLTEAYLTGAIGLTPIARVRGVDEVELRREFLEAGLAPRPLVMDFGADSFAPASAEDLEDLDRILTDA